ncbi:MAG TPA: tetratricopeptide repeat protein [Dehalococcoidia bacterium]|nr:tetratricopeptide repeat protein [Dehalococcoidia bacterium]
MNDKDSESFYVRVPDLLRQLSTLEPLDAEAHFWIGYAFVIFPFENEFGVEQLRRCLALEENHGYAHLALAGMDWAEPDEARRHLEGTLDTQPTNYRALHQLAALELEAGNVERATSHLEVILAQEPHTETSYGFMNEYVNAVLNGSSLRDQNRARASMLRPRP